MEGTGNDFILIDNRAGLLRGEIKLTDLVKKICNRKFGVGADGVLLIEKDEKTAFLMRYFNSGGDEAAMCGNGARCMARFAERLGVASRKFTFRTKSGIHEAEITGDDIKLKVETARIVQVEKKVTTPSAEFTGDLIDVGIPHFVIYVDDIDELNVKKLGREIRNVGEFKPNGTNVNFIKIEKKLIKIRTYERGVENETLACGTGSIAAAISASLHYNLLPPAQIQTRGGELKIYFKKSEKQSEKAEFSNIYLEGPARFICDGIYYYE